MNYDQARKNIKSGDLLAWSHRGWRTLADWQIQAIRVFGRTEYSHVGIAWRIAGRLFVIEAVGSGVRIFPLSRASPFYWLPTHAGFSFAAEQAALSRVGEKYSKWDALIAFFNALRIGDNQKWQCAEFVLFVMRIAGVDLGERAVPSSLVERALQQGFPCYLVGRT